MPLAATQIHPDMQRAAEPSFPNGSLNAGQYTLLFRIRHARNKTLLREHRLVLMPQRFSQTTEARTALYYTKGAIVADTPADGGVGMTVFTIVGHTGYWGVPSPMFNRLTEPATPQAFAQVVQQVFSTVSRGADLPRPSSLIDGAAAIKDLQDMIFAYFDPGSGPEIGVTQTQDLQLEFLNLTAPTSAEDRTGRVGWIIHPHRNLVDLQQDATKPFLYNYSFQFAGIAALEDAEVPDVFVQAMANARTGFQEGMRRLNEAVRDVTNGINTIEDAFQQTVIQNVTGPISTFLAEVNNLGNAVGNFISEIADLIRFPLYAQREISHVLDAPRHSVTTLAEAARQLGEFLVEAADPRSIGRTLAGETLTGGVNDDLTVSVNHEDPVTLHLGTQTSGEAIAAAIQARIQATEPQHTANASAYRDFTATFADSQYTLSSGTKLSNAASVEVVVNADPVLTPTDASPTLGLGVANGGQEHAGSAYPLPALALLRGVEEACIHLQAFPDYFAVQLDAQDQALAALLPPGMTRPQIRGDQRLRQTRVTPGDSLQGIAARVGVPWETLALVNRLTYPFIIESPATLVRGRVSSADLWSLTDVIQAWPAHVYDGQRVDILAGAGAGQSRRILRHTPTQLVLEHAWDVVPNDTSDYAIRSADNPIVRTGAVTSATARTVTNGAQILVPESQRGLTMVLTSGSTAGERRRVVANDQETYVLETPWDVVPTAGTLYLLLGAGPATRRQKLVGDVLSVPQPSAQTLTPIRSRLQDVSAITGQALSTEEKLFGRDLLLDPATMALVYDPARGDAVSIAGLPNLRQALIHLVNLPIGELEYAPGLGSYVQEELGLTATLPLQIQLLASVERTIRQDSRIARMSGASLVTQGGVSLITFGATAIDGSTIDRVVIR
jgi:ElaB/YqjD/DUF883 family membrane-anchored ribosome-binding protein